MYNLFQILGQKAIEMMMAISPLMKMSDKIRDLLIDVLRKAIYDRYDFRTHTIKNINYIKITAGMCPLNKWEYMGFV